MTINRLLIKSVAAASIFAAAIASPAVYAADTGTTTTVPSCSKGKIWDKKKKRCVKPAQDSSLTDDNLFEAARDLAYNRRYREAQTVLKLAKNKNDPRILNYLGYTTRKLGDIEGALKYYQTALAIDPNYTLVREYMGEAYIQLGNFEKATEQLAEIRKRCGTDCREYRLLRAALDGAKIES